MSAGGNLDIACACGHHFKAWIWQSANVTTSPELRDLVLAGDMNVVRCPSCGDRFHVEIPFLYHDMAAREWIWVHPAAYEEESGTVRAKALEMWDEVSRAFPEVVRDRLEREYRVRVFFGMDALVAHLRAGEGGAGETGGAS
jgi:hypothetical protein